MNDQRTTTLRPRDFRRSLRVGDTCILRHSNWQPGVYHIATVIRASKTRFTVKTTGIEQSFMVESGKLVGGASDWNTFTVYENSEANRAYYEADKARTDRASHFANLIEQLTDIRRADRRAAPSQVALDALDAALELCKRND